MLYLDHAKAIDRVLARASRGHLNISDAGLIFIESFEGVVLELYDDPAGNATCGIGHLVHLGPYHRNPGEDPACDSFRAGLSEDQARTLLRQDVADYADCVTRTTYVPLNQHQFDALTSFTFNVGQGGFINSSVRVAVNTGGDVRDALMQYVHGSDGVVYPGLVSRRTAEGILYYQPEEDLMSAEFDKLKAALDALYGSLISLAQHVYAEDDAKLADVQKKLDAAAAALK